MKYQTFFASTTAAAMAVVLSLASTAGAFDIQDRGQIIVDKASVKLTKGAYETFTLDKQAGVTTSVTGTASGTVASFSLSGSALVATVTTTVTGTTGLLDKKQIAKGKFGNKELLNIILNGADPKGFSLVWVSTDGVGNGSGGLLDGTDKYVGARKKGDTNIIILDLRTTNSTPYVAAGGNYNYFQSIVAGKKNTNEKTVTGFGGVEVSFGAPLSDFFKKTTIGGVSNVEIFTGSSGTFKETVQQDPVGFVTNNAKASFTSKPTFGGGGKY